jgi:colanic acid biosynthesis glycosyl transferase WcaI
MRILFLGLNYAPEQIGIAVYSAGLCEYLAAAGHEVHAIVGKPYYPEWRTYEGFRGGGARRSVENGVSLTRVPHYVPAEPSGARRMAHLTSFGAAALAPTLAEARRFRPDLVFTVAPSLIAAPVARLAAQVSGAKSWLHIQDFEVEAAFATGLIDSVGMLARAAKAFEHRVLRSFDQVSSISYEMCTKARNIGARQVYEFRNWADLDAVRPLESPSAYRERWGIVTEHVALYSGNIANKQGIEILVDVARLLQARADLTFVICGQGPNRAALEARAAGLANVQFHDLQPIAELNQLTGLASVHLLPQKAGAADLVLPSKMTNMLASGRPVIATAHADTGLAREVAGCGRVVPPEDAPALAAAIVELLDSPVKYRQAAANARQRALANWDRRSLLGDLETQLRATVGL